MKKNLNSGKLQQGGRALIDEDELFSDIDSVGDEGASGAEGSPLGDELINQGEDGDTIKKDVAGQSQDPPVNSGSEEEEEDDNSNSDDTGSLEGLTGVEKFLTSYGVQGGIITYEDGTEKPFSELDPEEQSNILASLVNESKPAIEDKYDLDDEEISLLNELRGSDLSTEDFINNIVENRVETLLASRDALNTDYEALSDEAIFVKSLKEDNPEITDESIAQELVKAKELSSFKPSVNALRQKYISAQQSKLSEAEQERNKVFNEELEAQRHEIVKSVEDIDDIAGASLTPQMKEYLLKDIMELNEDKDPILMEKIFSDPQTMFEANWFINYGKSYIEQINNYWKNEVSKARKTAYNEAIGKMPGNPTSLSNKGGRQQSPKLPNNDNNDIMDGDELFEE